uniref:Uncharacterized protein n=1 Tax=Sulfobacillus thermotolerans TaxID=338644 RepID=G5CJ36_9FIRM|nr:hypothetical protein [Sulfobacillus thermotolerans]
MKVNGTSPRGAFSSVYPYNLDKLVIHEVHMPALDLTLQASPWPTDRSGFPGVIREIYSEKDYYLALTTKRFPHAPFDAMIMAFGDNEKRSVHDLSTDGLNAVLRSGLAFIEFVQDPAVAVRYKLMEGHCCLIYNFDLTKDRENGMSNKRFHMHLNYWPSYTTLMKRPTTFANLSSVERVRLFDPLLFAGPGIVRDIIPVDTQVVMPCSWTVDEAIKFGLPIGSTFEIVGGWRTLQTERFAIWLQQVHESLANAYSNVRRELVQEPFEDPWSRPNLVPPDVRIKRIDAQPLSDDARKLLKYLAIPLQNLNPQLIQYLRSHKKLRIRHMSLQGLSYSVAFHPLGWGQDTKILVVVQLRLFTDIGGASLTYFPGFPLIRVQRNEGTLSASEIQTRVQFQTELADWLTR